MEEKFNLNKKNVELSSADEQSSIKGSAFESIFSIFKEYIKENFVHPKGQEDFISIPFPWATGLSTSPASDEEIFSNEQCQVSSERYGIYIGYKYFNTLIKNPTLLRIALSVINWEPILKSSAETAEPDMEDERELTSFSMSIEEELMVGRIFKYINQEDEGPAFNQGRYIYINLHENLFVNYHEIYEREGSIEKYVTMICFEELIHLIHSNLSSQDIFSQALSEFKNEHEAIAKTSMYYAKNGQTYTHEELHFEFIRTVVQEDLVGNTSEFVLLRNDRVIKRDKLDLARLRALLLTSNSANTQLTDIIKSFIQRVSDPTKLYQLEGDL